MSGILYIVATPIGNLSDVTAHALEILQMVDVIACEDTRHSQKFLQHYNIKKALIPLHQHNERSSAEALIHRLHNGENIALISDAGTPLISDPGEKLTRLAHQQNIQVSPIVGASSVMAALSASGLAANQFIFAGFIPNKNGERMQFLKQYQYCPQTVVFFESPHRLLDTVKVMETLFNPQRKLLIARELSKQFEQIKLIDLGSALAWLEDDLNRQKGEFVLILEAATESASWLDYADDLYAAGLSVKTASALVSKHFQADKREVYQYLLEKKL